jgi:hypothetical protein
MRDKIRGNPTKSARVRVWLETAWRYNSLEIPHQVAPPQYGRKLCEAADARVSSSTREIHMTFETFAFRTFAALISAGLVVAVSLPLLAAAAQVIR